MKRKDVIGAAETGSGKTLAFGLPILQAIVQQSCTDLIGLILVPTRELAIQVHDHLKNVAKNVTHKIVSIVGGMSIQKQERLLRSKPLVIVATPGRFWECMENDKTLAAQVKGIQFLVIDEADRMLEAGHFKQLDAILGHVNGGEVKRQTFVFSATMLEEEKSENNKAKKSKNVFQSLLEKIQFRDAKPVYINLSRQELTAKGVLESRVDCMKDEKDMMLYYLLSRYSGKTIVFVNSIDAIRRLVPIFSCLFPYIHGLHAEMQQKQRLKNLERFLASENAVLFASDVAARGLDIKGIDHVVHYQLPRSADIYVHRSGRTGRANSEGVSIMLCSPEEQSLYRKLLSSLKRQEIPEFPIEGSLFPALKKRLTIAKQIDQIEHSQKKKQKNHDWFKKAAQECDIELSESDSDEEENYKKANNQQKLNGLRLQLKALLDQPIVPKNHNVKYLTRELSSVVMAAKDTSTPTLIQSKATVELKRKRQ